MEPVSALHLPVSCVPDLQFDGVTGILLAAGAGTRFSPRGECDKLLQVIPGGEMVAVASARHLLAVLPRVVAVVRSESDALAHMLQTVGCDVRICATAGEGMGASLVHALSHARDSSGWVIALADMPYVKAETISRLASALRDGDGIAAPKYKGRRGNPVAFGHEHLDRLMKLRGDEGARRLLQEFPVNELETDDPGVVRDIDTIDDLRHTP